MELRNGHSHQVKTLFDFSTAADFVWVVAMVFIVVVFFGPLNSVYIVWF